MYIFSHSTYVRLSELILEAISDSDYYNGVVTLSTDQADIKLTSTLLVYRHKQIHEEDRFLNISKFKGEIYNISPVWWEVTTISDDGEIANDFDFKILKNIILI